MSSHGTDKMKLSKNLLQMKFMQRSVVQAEQDQNEEERQKIIDDEHWRLDIPQLKEKESKYQLEASYVLCEQLPYGRMSYKGFNPEIEKLMKHHASEQISLEEEGKEKEMAVSDDDMAERYESIVGTIAKKFSKKRQRPTVTEEDGTTKKKKSKKFLKPKDD